MRKQHLISLVILFSLVFQSIYAQQTSLPIRGSRGYVPPPKEIKESSIELLDPFEEMSLILPKCVEVFELDDFEKEIIKGILLKKFENQNLIISDEGNSKDDRKIKLSELNKNFFNELAIILSAEEIERFKFMDFTEYRKEQIKQNKKKKRKKRKT